MEIDRFRASYDVLSGTLTKAQTCKQYNITRSSLNWAVSKFLTQSDFSRELRHQMLLGAKLGDGYFQLTKHNIYKYRESHSINELDYTKWKYLLLHNWSNNTKIVNKNNGTAVELYTSASHSKAIEYYYNLTIEQVIQEINIYGLLFYLLDDGWYSEHSKVGNYYIASTVLTNKQKELLLKKFAIYNIQANLIGKRQDISFPSKYNYIFLVYLLLIVPSIEIDIIQKKFGTTFNSLKNLTMV